MIQSADYDRIKSLKEERIRRWGKASRLVADSSYEVLKDFRSNNRLKRLK